MEISPGLIARGTAAVGGTSAICAGSYYGYNSLSAEEENIKTIITPEGEKIQVDMSRKDPLPTSKYDNALIDYLNKNNQINFEIKGYDNDKLTWSDIVTFSVLEMKVNVNEALKDKDSFKNLNKGESWEWICRISIGRDKNLTSYSLNEAENSKVRNLIEKLKGTDNKEAKIKFIRNCAKMRDLKNKEIDSLDKLKSNGDIFSYHSDNKLFSINNFELAKNGNEDNLKFSDEYREEFEKWFGTVGNEN